MPAFEPALVHMPITPFNRDHRIDFDRFGTVIDFHLRHGTDALALPMHVGESVSLSENEKRAVLAFAVDRVQGRLPVIAHVSNAGTAIAAALARAAEQAGAAAIIATTPYYWTPPAAMLLEHFVQIGSAVHIPLLVLNAPDEPGKVRQLVDELEDKLRPDLRLFAG